MRAHIVGAGLSSLAAAVYLIEDGGLQGNDICLYDSSDRLGGAMATFGGPDIGYVLPTGRVFEKHYRCAFDLFSRIPSSSDSNQSINDEIAAFNQRHGYDDRARIVDRQGRIVTSAHFGLSAADILNLVKLALASEESLDGRRIEEFFSEAFFQSEFWILWTTLMNSLPQHSAIEFRRFMIRFLDVLPSLSNMRAILRTRFNQYDAIVTPIADWLRKRGVHFWTHAWVDDVQFQRSGHEITACSMSYLRDEVRTSIELSSDDLLLVCVGSQVADLAFGSMAEPAKLELSDRSWSLWRKLSRHNPAFGRPEAFFGPEHVSDTKWVTFTVTSRDSMFVDFISARSGGEVGRSGLMTFRDSSWLLTVAIFHQPEFVGQPTGLTPWWGFALYPDRTGDFVEKPMSECTGAEILEETLRHARLDQQIDTIMKSSICIPCVLPYAGAVWMPRKHSDRPKVVPDGSTNFGFIGQFSELPKDACFTMEYSVRSAREAVSTLLKLDAKPPAVYQGTHDPHALYEAARALWA